MYKGPNSISEISNPAMELPLHKQFENEAMSPDSVYDETLGFPYSPSSLNQYIPTISQLDVIQETSGVEGNRGERPYTAIYDRPVKFNSCEREIFIANVDIKVQITD
ncbi:unnamed protein product [Diamesa serratosioi]